MPVGAPVDLEEVEPRFGSHVAQVAAAVIGEVGELDRGGVEGSVEREPFGEVASRPVKIVESPQEHVGGSGGLAFGDPSFGVDRRGDLS